MRSDASIDHDTACYLRANTDVDAETFLHLPAEIRLDLVRSWRRLKASDFTLFHSDEGAPSPAGAGQAPGAATETGPGASAAVRPEVAVTAAADAGARTPLKRSLDSARATQDAAATSMGMEATDACAASEWNSGAGGAGPSFNAAHSPSGYSLDTAPHGFAAAPSGGEVPDDQSGSEVGAARIAWGAPDP